MSSRYRLDDEMRGSGIYVNQEAGETLGNHKLVYSDGASAWSLADANAAATMPVIGITMGAIPAGRKGEILFEGYIGDPTWTWNPGESIYASTVAGELTNVAPVAPDLIQIVAVARTATMIYFNSDLGSGGGSGECAILEGHTAYVGSNACREPQTNYWVVDGVADDVQINAALTYVNGLGGGSVFLERGTYTIVDPITFPGNNLMLVGVGRDTFIDGDGLATTEHAIVISGRTNCVVRDLAIQTQDGGAKTCHCIFLEDGSNYFKIQNVTIVDSDSDGIHIEGTTIDGGEIINCTVLDVDDIGINISMDAGNILAYTTISENYVTGAGGDGINLTRAFESSFENNIVRSNGGDGLEVNTSTNVRIIDNTIFSNVQHGIYFVNSDSSKISDNVVRENDSGNTATYDGIHLDTNSTDNMLTNNLCRYNHRHGIYVIGARNQILGNMCQTNDEHGIVVNGTICQIDGNSSFDNSQDSAGTSHGIYLMANADRVTVSNNKVDGFGDSQEDGIRLADGASQVEIRGNYCYNGMGSGISLEANNDDCHIEGNYLSTNDDYGVEIEAATCNNNYVFDNKFVGNVTGAISDGGTDTATPEIFIPVTDPDDVLGTHPVLTLTDGITVNAYSQIGVPLSYQELVSSSAIVVAGGAGDLRRSVDTNWGKICSTEDYDANTDTIAAGVVAVLQDDMTCIDISAALTSIAGGDLIGVKFTRIGGDASDTVNADCYYLGIRVRYV